MTSLNVQRNFLYFTNNCTLEVHKPSIIPKYGTINQVGTHVYCSTLFIVEQLKHIRALEYSIPTNKLKFMDWEMLILPLQLGTDLVWRIE